MSLSPESPKYDSNQPSLVSSNVPSTERRGIASNLSDESFQTLVHIITDKNDPVRVLQGLSYLPYVFKVSLPEELEEELGAIAKNYNDEIVSYQNLDYKTAADLLYNLNNECARALQEKLSNAIETLGTDAATVMCLQTAKCAIQFFISDNSIPHETSINIARRGINWELQSFSYWSTIYEEYSPLDIKGQPLGFQKRVADLASLECENGFKYTPFSPQIFMNLIYAVDDARSDAISHSVITSYSLNEVISNKLSNGHYRRMNLTQKGNSIIINWDKRELPLGPFSYEAIPACFDRFRSNLEPLQTLLRELGGDIECKLDNDQDVVATIIFPQTTDNTHLLQSQSFWKGEFKDIPDDVICLDKETGVCEPLVALYTQGHIAPRSSRISVDVNFSFPHQDGSGRTFDVKIDKGIFLTDMFLLRDVLFDVEELNSNHSISDVVIKDDDPSDLAWPFDVQITFNSTSIGGEYDEESTCRLYKTYDKRRHLR